jgi:hypothetical protein
MIVLIIALALLLTVLNCAPGNERFTEEAAGFFAGLWHGFICFFTFIISLFSKTVQIYEMNNTGGWYDFGFILGAAIFFGGSGKTQSKKKICKSGKEKEWEEIGIKVEGKVRKGIQNWLDESKEKDKDWEEIGKKIEEKIKRELKNWAEK